MIGKTAQLNECCYFRVVAILGRKVVGLSEGAQRMHISLQVALALELLIINRVFDVFARPETSCP